MKLNVLQPDRSSLMIKPVGPKCNLDCTYCYYLPRHELFGRVRRMTDETLESLFAGFLPNMGQRVTIGWQGGEPTLAGVPFFERAMTFQRRYARPGQHIDNALQTNGTLLDDDWCRFLAKHHFLVGVSLDGPKTLHDHYRLDRKGRSTHATVVDNARRLKSHNVPFNVLCVLNDRNIQQPEQLFQNLVDQGYDWLQFIPAIEWRTTGRRGKTPQLAPFSPTPDQYGRFLCRLFDLWFARYRHTVSVRFFDSALHQLVTGHAAFCMLDISCDAQITVEHDGSIFLCDHFVEPRWKVGTIAARPEPPIKEDSQNVPSSTSPIDRDWPWRLDADRFERFGNRKRNLPPQCQKCQWRQLCFGGCPKHRPHQGIRPEPTVLCASYRKFYKHAIGRLRRLASSIQHNDQPLGQSMDVTRRDAEPGSAGSPRQPTGA